MLFRVRDSNGLRYLARLLAAPGEELHALALVGGEPTEVRARPLEEGLSVGRLGDAGELIDAQAQAAYRERIEELQEEIEEAESWNDPERAAKAQEERDFIVRELAAAVGLGGRSQGGFRRRTGPRERHALVEVRDRAPRRAQPCAGRASRADGADRDLLLLHAGSARSDCLAALTWSKESRGPARVDGFAWSFEQRSVRSSDGGSD